MDNGYQRNTVFLYPDLAGCGPDERMSILNLITEITSIVQMANRQFQELINSGKFSFVNCMPKVYMRCVSDDPEVFEDQDNVRICVTKFDSHDYTANYQSLTRKYKSGETNISHLVALNLYSRPQKTQFFPDPNDQFNVIINTSMDFLEKILVSIMFDISLYHYFLLSNSLHERKIFNTIKYKYIVDHYTPEKQKDNYGAILSPNSTMYLPISLPEVKKISRHAERDTRQCAVARLLQLFATFLVCTQSLCITSDQQGNIMNPSDKLPKEIQETVERLVLENCRFSEYIIVFLHDSAQKYQPIVLECENGEVPCWITRDCEGKAFRHVILVKQLG